MALQPGTHVELPIEREAATSGTRPSAIAYVIGRPKAVKTALPADGATRAAAREVLEEGPTGHEVIPPGRKRPHGCRPVTGDVA